MSKITISIDCGLDGLTFTQPSKVHPQFAKDADIGVIVSRFLKSGQIPQFVEKPTYDTIENLPQDFSELMDRTTKVRQQFELLPEEERARFNNSCDNWLAYFAEQENKSSEESSEEPVDKVGDKKVDKMVEE